MIELRKVIKSILKEHHPNITVEGKSLARVHHQRSTPKTPFPYIVYDLPNSFVDEDQEIFNLDLDIYDNKSDETELELLSKKFWDLFDRYSHIDENIQFTVYRENRLPPLEDDPKIKRRKLIFQLRYLERN